MTAYNDPRLDSWLTLLPWDPRKGAAAASLAVVRTALHGGKAVHELQG